MKLKDVPALRLALLTGCTIVSFGGVAQATPITYTFTGTGSGTLDGTAFTDFTLKYVGDTKNVTFGGTEFTNVIVDPIVSAGGATDTLTGIGDEVVLNTNPGGTPVVGFVQIGASPFVVAEALVSPVLAGYGLDHAFPLTTGDLSTQVGSLFTTNGNLTFDSIGSLTFEASGVPEPSAWATMLAGFGVLGASMRMRRKQTAVA